MNNLPYFPDQKKHQDLSIQNILYPFVAQIHKNILNKMALQYGIFTVIESPKILATTITLISTNVTV
jgi:hypothetical protein